MDRWHSYDRGGDGHSDDTTRLRLLLADLSQTSSTCANCLWNGKMVSNWWLFSCNFHSPSAKSVVTANVRPQQQYETSTMNKSTRCTGSDQMRSFRCRWKRNGPVLLLKSIMLIHWTDDRHEETCHRAQPILVNKERRLRDGQLIYFSNIWIIFKWKSVPWVEKSVYGSYNILWRHCQSADCLGGWVSKYSYSHH